jgi:methyl-accepting chemotaxis protein
MDKRGKIMDSQSNVSEMSKKLKDALKPENAFETIDEALMIVENVPDNVMYCDRSLVIRYMNRKSQETLKSLEKLLPVPAERVLGSNIDVFHRNVAHQRRILGDDRNLPLKSKISLGPELLELNVHAIYNQSREYIGAMVSWSVITEKLKLEQEVQNQKLLVAALGKAQATIEFGLDGTITMANDNFLRAMGYTLEEIKGKQHSMFCDPTYAESAVYREFWAKLNRGEFQSGEYMRLTKDRKQIWIQATYNPVYDSSGKVVKVVELAADVTARKEAALELTRALEETAGQLAAAAEELTATANQLSQNSELTLGESNTAAAATEEVSKGVQAVATNTEEMVASIKEIARNSSEAANISKETMSKAQSTNSTITNLGVSSQEIGNVIKVISSIAQQTNLLALNATIEAARAGDAGKGFAVVANEVKELAKQTAKATEDITNRIGAIQKDTQGAVDAIGGISQFIEKLNGISMAIAAAIEEQTATTNEVARVVKESNVGVEGIAEVVKSVATAAGQSSTGASQTLDAARSLAQLAEKLKTLVKGIRG